MFVCFVGGSRVVLRMKGVKKESESGTKRAVKRDLNVIVVNNERYKGSGTREFCC